ncbi:Hypothetical_protein [Hexamita inflata]|uniref:Hypothetical_protein n=1 Tax=Hexamita inflata TaxID=28002 RepID=A0AA86UHU6_9EUKA|nr:Hypothetical protein HINF_LOCUS28338 [Hexamita inflata]
MKLIFINNRRPKGCICAKLFSRNEFYQNVIYNYVSHSLNFRFYQFGLLYKNCKFTRMIISFRYTYVRQAHHHSQGNQRLGYKHPGAQHGCFVQADLYGNHLRRTICVSKEAMERLPFSNPEGSLMAAQHFELGDFTFRNRFGRAASQDVGCGEEREAQPCEPIIDQYRYNNYLYRTKTFQLSNS